VSAVGKALRPFSSRIVAWQRTHGRHDLPWQNTRDPYRIWLSEIMLQQTQVTAVIPYYTRFLQSFPDVAALAAAPLDRVLQHWSGLGYYRRAHYLHAAALAVMTRHEGKFPRDAATLETLPGIGRSTAAAIAVFAAGERAAILDGNVKRVLARHAGVDGWPGAPKVEAVLWDIAAQRLPDGASSERPRGANDCGKSAAQPRLPDGVAEAYTQGLMDLGATLCTRSSPRCGACPVAADCVALRDDRIAQLPAARPKKTLPQREVRVLLLERAGEFLFEKRAPLGIWGGLWSLPECDVVADMHAEIRARFGAEAEPAIALAPIEHGFTHFALTMHPHRMQVRRWPQGVAAPGTLWIAPADAAGAALPAPIKALMRALAAERTRSQIS
jgi:A/G-specific adenine glycosylase